MHTEQAKNSLEFMCSRVLKLSKILSGAPLEACKLLSRRSRVAITKAALRAPCKPALPADACSAAQAQSSAPASLPDLDFIATAS